MMYLEELLKNTCFKLLIIMVVFDTVFGILRALREKKINSSIGIEGMIRKAGMIISSLFLFVIDQIISLNLLGFIPADFRSILNIGTVGIGDLFGILFIVFEGLSVLKNMYKIKMPIPKKFQNLLKKLLTEFTEEVKEKEGEK